MSHRQTSNLRRSRSSTNIPHLINSRLSTRDSNQKGIVRSSSRLDLPKSRSVDRNARPSTSTALAGGSSIGRPIGRQGSSSLLRPSGVTPLNRAGSKLGSKSPKSSVRKDNRPITDKQWQYTQLVKVRTFVAENFSDLDLDYNNIKSGISLDYFIELTYNLFQLIDYRINITRENYITEVPVNLNRYQYPVSVKPSLMKTVNTPHCWPSVLAIFSWLVDFVNEINIEEEWTDDYHDVVDKAVFESYCLWNLEAQESEFRDQVFTNLEEDLGRIFEVNKEDTVNLDQKIANLQGIARQQKLKIKNYAEEMESLQSNTDVINEKCDNYTKEMNELHKALTKNLDEFSEKVITIEQELSINLKMEENLQNLIATQPHSHAEKLQLTEQIKALTNTQILKEEKLKQQRELLNTCDYRLVQLKQEIESTAYKYNSIIDELELVNAEFRYLHIKDTGFTSMSVKQEFEKVKGIIEKFISHLMETHCVIKDKRSSAVERNERLESEISVIKKTVEQLSTIETEFDLNLKHETKKLDEEINKMKEILDACQTKSEEVKKEKLVTLTSLQKLAEEKQTKLNNLKDYKEDRKNKAVIFFQNIRTTTNSNLDVYQQQMRRITEELLKLKKRQIESKRSAIEVFKQMKLKNSDKK